MEDDGPPRSTADEETARILREGHDYILSLPPDERHIATMAHLLDRVVAALTGRMIDAVETGGLGADTDPGVTGGYDPEPFGDESS